MIKLQWMPGRLLVGLSGGADSVALLLLLLDAGAQVSAVHVNHGLRGEESDGDEAFVRQLCAEHDVPLLTFRARPPENPGEGWAREMRYGFFRQAMQATDSQALVLAHHRDDQAETLLLHLLRGTGMSGLTGMASDTVMNGMRILRPLLGYSRVQLREYLLEKQQPWREDGSNGDPRYLRNALRLDVLPRLEELLPGTGVRIAAAAEILREDHSALDALAAEFLAAYPGRELPLPELRAKPAGLQKRILRAWWESTAGHGKERSLSSAQTQQLHELLNSPASAKCNLPGGWHGQVGWTHVHLIPPGESAGIPETAAEESNLLSIGVCDGAPGDGVTCQAIPQEWLAECTVRSRRKGDYIRPFGSAGTQSLQDYFVNRRIDAAFRDRIPLLCRGSEVLLAGGAGAGGIPKLNEIHNAVLILWKQQFPWQRAQKK